MQFTASFNNITTSATLDTFITVAGILVPDTAGSRVRISGFNIGVDDDTPQDANILVRLARIDDVSAGTAGTATTTISAANVQKIDTLSADSPASVTLDYSAEPTTYNTNTLFEHGMNLHGGIIKEFVVDREKIVVGRDQLVGILVAPRTSVAANISGSIQFEQF